MSHCSTCTGVTPFKHRPAGPTTPCPNHRQLPSSQGSSQVQAQILAQISALTCAVSSYISHSDVRAPVSLGELASPRDAEGLIIWVSDHPEYGKCGDTGLTQYNHQCIFEADAARTACRWCAWQPARAAPGWRQGSAASERRSAGRPSSLRWRLSCCRTAPGQQAAMRQLPFDPAMALDSSLTWHLTLTLGLHTHADTMASSW